MKFKVGDKVRFKHDTFNKSIPDEFDDNLPNPIHGSRTLGNEYFENFATITYIFDDNRYGVKWTDRYTKVMHLAFIGSVLQLVEKREPLKMEDLIL